MHNLISFYNFAFMKAWTRLIFYLTLEFPQFINRRNTSSYMGGGGIYRFTPCRLSPYNLLFRQKNTRIFRMEISGVLVFPCNDTDYLNSNNNLIT